VKSSPSRSLDTSIKARASTQPIERKRRERPRKRNKKRRETRETESERRERLIQKGREITLERGRNRETGERREERAE